MRNKLTIGMMTLVVMLAIITTACGGYTTSISSRGGRIDHGKLCSRIEFLDIDDELREDLLLVFACNETPD